MPLDQEQVVNVIPFEGFFLRVLWTKVENIKIARDNILVPTGGCVGLKIEKQTYYMQIDGSGCHAWLTWTCIWIDM